MCTRELVCMFSTKFHELICVFIKWLIMIYNATLVLFMTAWVDIASHHQHYMSGFNHLSFSLQDEPNVILFTVFNRHSSSLQKQLCRNCWRHLIWAEISAQFESWGHRAGVSNIRFKPRKDTLTDRNRPHVADLCFLPISKILVHFLFK